MSIEAEVCRAHRDAYCRACDEFNDDLWVYPRDLPPPHEDCRLCHQLAAHREAGIEKLSKSIEELEDEIAEIQRGMRHTAYHEKVLADEGANRG